MAQRSGYAIGKRENRDPSSSVRQISSASSCDEVCLELRLEVLSCSTNDDLLFGVLVFALVSDFVLGAAFTDPPLRVMASFDTVRGIPFSASKSGSEPPRKFPRNANPFLFRSSGGKQDLAGPFNPGNDADTVAKQPIEVNRAALFPRGIFSSKKSLFPEISSTRVVGVAVLAPHLSLLCR
jgi:hypothetical protein